MAAETRILITARDRASAAFRKTSLAAKGLERSMFSLQGAMAGAGVAAFGVSVFQAGVQMDRLRRSFDAITGDAGKSGQEFAYLRAEAERLGLSFYDLAEAYKGVLAATKDTGLEGEQTREIFSALAESSAALGLSMADTQGILRAFTQMVSKGKVQAEELRGQLGERLYGAFQKAADAMGVSTAQLNTMLERGEVLAEDLLPKLAKVLHEALGEAAEKNADSAAGAVARLHDAWKDLKVTLADSGFLDAATAGLKGLSMVADSIGWALGNQSTGDRLRSIRTEISHLGQELAGLEGSEFTDKRTLVGLFRADDEAARIRKRIAELKAEQAILRGGMGKYADYRPEKHDAVYTPRSAVAEDVKAAAEKLRKAWEKAEAARVAAVQTASDEITRIRQGEFALERAQLERQVELMLEDVGADKAAQDQIADYRKLKLDEIAAEERQHWADMAEERRAAMEQALEDSREMADGVKRGLASYADSATNAAEQMESVTVSAFQGMEDQLVAFVTTGKMEFSNLANSIIADLMRIAIRTSITGPLSGWLGGLFSGGGINRLGGSGAGVLSSIAHAGGVIGVDSTPSRSVPTGVFAGAQRFHSGLMPDEFPAILQRGEGVFTQAQMQALGGRNEMHVHVHNAPEGTTVEESTGPNGSREVHVMVGEAMAKDLRSGGASFRAVRDMFGLKTKGRGV